MPSPQGARFGRIKTYDQSRRVPVQVSLGCPLQGAALPHPDPCCPQTMKKGCEKRFACDPPPCDRKLLAEFREFYKGYVRRKYPKLASTTDLSVEAWLEERPYTEGRKRELRTKWSEFGGNILQKKYTKAKSFMKDEVYEEFKHARGINSRSDVFKCYSGPLFSAMEKIVFKDPNFIKKIPVKDRPSYVLEHLRPFLTGLEGIITETDHSTYEAAFVKEIMLVEFELYRWMCSDHPEALERLSVIEKVLTGTNVCDFKWFTVEVEAKRLSGETNTSLGNGTINDGLMAFVAYKQKLQYRGIFEGDDGLCAWSARPDFSLIERMGFKLKPLYHKAINKASFCGLIFDVESGVNITNPFVEIATMGWTRNQYFGASQHTRRGLLRCKGMSMLYQYPGCPILTSVGSYLMRVAGCSDAKVRQVVFRSRLNEWEREQLKEAYFGDHEPKPVPETARALMEEVYGIDREVQLAIESYFDGLNQLGPLDPPGVWRFIPPAWREYWDQYVHPVTNNPVLYNHPPLHQATLARATGGTTG